MKSNALLATFIMLLISGCSPKNPKSEDGVQKIQFKNRDITVVGNLFAPPGYIKNQKYPAIIVGHPAGGGFAINAAQTEHRLKAVATISMVDLGQLRREGINGMLSATKQQRLDAVAAQHPNSPNKYMLSSLDKLMAFTALDQVEMISLRPILLIADSLYFSEEAYQKAP